MCVRVSDDYLIFFFWKLIHESRHMSDWENVSIQFYILFSLIEMLVVVSGIWMWTVTICMYNFFFFRYSMYAKSNKPKRNEMAVRTDCEEKRNERKKTIQVSVYRRKKAHTTNTYKRFAYFGSSSHLRTSIWWKAHTIKSSLFCFKISIKWFVVAVAIAIAFLLCLSFFLSTFIWPRFVSFLFSIHIFLSKFICLCFIENNVKLRISSIFKQTNCVYWWELKCIWHLHIYV